MSEDECNELVKVRYDISSVTGVSAIGMSKRRTNPLGLTRDF